MNSRWQHGGNIYEIQRQQGIAPASILDFSANINPLGFPAGLTEAITGGLSDLVHYPDPDYVDLKGAIAGVQNLRPEWVYPGNGAIELIYMVMEFLKPRRAHVMAPGFVEYERSLRRFGAEVSWIRLLEADDFKLTAEALEPALGHSEEPLVLCTPNNPTGALIAPELLERILERAYRAGQPVILDEAFMEFVAPDRAPGCTQRVLQYPNLFVLRSMTKCYAVPGLRLGYLVTASPGFAQWVQAYRIPWMVNHLAALAGQSALKDSGHLERTRAYVAVQRERLLKGMGALQGLKVYPAEANFICFRLVGSKLDLKAALLEKGILIRSCANYIGMDNTYYRVAVRRAEENDLLLAALAAVL